MFQAPNYSYALRISSALIFSASLGAGRLVATGWSYVARVEVLNECNVKFL